MSLSGLKKLDGVHYDLVKVIKETFENSKTEYLVIEGLRTLERQKELVASGNSKTLNSRHLTGHAVDIAPLTNGKIHWDDKDAFFKMATQIKNTAVGLGVELNWGGDFKSFFDGPHFELCAKKYPNQKKA